MELRRHRLDDARVRVTVDERRHVVGEVEAPFALDIHDPASFAAVRIERMRFAEDGVPAGTAGHDSQRALVERTAA
jgi:hypothetical protein